MYELQNINKTIEKEFWQSIFQALKKSNWDKIIFVTVKKTFHEITPNLPTHFLEPYMKLFMQDISKLKDANFEIRDFENDIEREEVFYSTYNELIKKLENSNDFTDKYNLELIDYIYELLLYDKVAIIDNKKYLYSHIYLSIYGELHLKAYQELKQLKINKPAEKNFDIATNTNKNTKSKISFVKEILQPKISNPLYNSSKEETQYNFLQDFEKSSHITVRAIYEFSKIQDDTDEQKIQAIAEMQPMIDSDDKIEYKDIYISWYAYVFSIYKRFSIPIPTKKLLRLARLSSYVLFESLRSRSKPLINSKTALKEIREVAFFRGLRLMDFSDMRKKIKKQDDEIEFTEKYLSHIIKNIQQFI